MARDRSPKCKQCRREGMKLFLKGERCLTEKCAIERRCYPPGEHGRGRIKQSRVPAAAAREAEGAPLLRPAREAVPHLLREGDRRDGHHRREPAADARDAARQRRLPARLRGVARAGAPARAARPLPRQRPPREHPELPGQAGRRHHAVVRARRPSRSSATRPTSPRPSRPGCRPTTTASPARSSSGRSGRRSTRRSRNQLIVELYSK